MSCSVTERISSTSTSVPSASNTSATIGSATISGAATVGTSSSQTSRWGGRLGFDGNSLSTLATSPNSRSTAQGAAGTPGGAGPPQNGPQSSSPQGSQLRAKPCSSMLLCCCCKCPWSNPGNKNDENGTAKNSSSDLDTCVSPSPMEEVRVTMDELRSWGKSFDNLMKSSSGRKVFRNFLKGEYSEENILFWLACEDFKHMDKASIERRARLIYMHYIHPASSTEVSLDSRVREIVKKHLPDPQPTMYDEAQLQIYTLMQRDSYPRFVNSQMFKTLVQQTEKKGRDKVSFWIQPQKTPSLHTIDLSTPELMGGDHGQASQSTPLLIAAHPSATTPVSEFSDRDQDAS